MKIDEGTILDRRRFLQVLATAGTMLALAGRVADAFGRDDEPARSADGHNVVVEDFTFKPATVTVPVGATVMWTNLDDVPHNVVSTDRKFKSPALDTDEHFSHTFDAPGIYTYFCSIHPRMTGEVVVK